MYGRWPVIAVVIILILISVALPLVFIRNTSARYQNLLDRWQADPSAVALAGPICTGGSPSVLAELESAKRDVHKLCNPAPGIDGCWPPEPDQALRHVQAARGPLSPYLDADPRLREYDAALASFMADIASGREALSRSLEAQDHLSGRAVALQQLAIEHCTAAYAARDLQVLESLRAAEQTMNWMKFAGFLWYWGLTVLIVVLWNRSHPQPDKSPGNPPCTREEREGLGCLRVAVVLVVVPIVFWSMKSPSGSRGLDPATATPAAAAAPTVATRAPGPIARPTAPSAQAEQVIVQPVVNANANLRAGPGTTFSIVGSVRLGQNLTLVARNPAGDWLRLEDGAWIFVALVTAAPDLPVAKDIPILPLPGGIRQP